MSGDITMSLKNLIQAKESEYNDLIIAISKQHQHLLESIEQQQFLLQQQQTLQQNHQAIQHQQQEVQKKEQTLQSQQQSLQQQQKSFKQQQEFLLQQQQSLQLQQQNLEKQILLVKQLAKEVQAISNNHIKIVQLNKYKYELLQIVNNTS